MTKKSIKLIQVIHKGRPAWIIEMTTQKTKCCFGFNAARTERIYYVSKIMAKLMLNEVTKTLSKSC